MESPHEVLGVDSDADEEELRDAFRRRAKDTHPDQGGSARAFKRVKTAYEELLDGSPEGDLTDRWDAVEEEEDDEEVVVEYLNYEVLDDHGWSLTDEALFEHAAEADLAESDYGEFTGQEGDSLLEAAEDAGFTWPFSCRGGACANCAVAVVEGDLSMPPNHILSDDLVDRGIQLSCVGTPVTEDMKVVFNVKHMPDVEDLLLPPGPFKQVQADD